MTGITVLCLHRRVVHLCMKREDDRTIETITNALQGANDSTECTRTRPATANSSFSSIITSATNNMRTTSTSETLNRSTNRQVKSALCNFLFRFSQKRGYFSASAQDSSRPGGTIPKGWHLYTPFGTGIPGTPFICFKTPLNEAVLRNNRVKESLW